MGKIDIFDNFDFFLKCWLDFLLLLLYDRPILNLQIGRKSGPFDNAMVVILVLQIHYLQTRLRFFGPEKWAAGGRRLETMWVR